MKRHVWIIAAVVGLAATMIGLSQGQWSTVLAWGRTVCASCIGLTN